MSITEIIDGTNVDKTFPVLPPLDTQQCIIKMKEVFFPTKQMAAVTCLDWLSPKCLVIGLKTG